MIDTAELIARLNEWGRYSGMSIDRWDEHVRADVAAAATVLAAQAQEISAMRQTILGMVDGALVCDQAEQIAVQAQEIERLTKAAVPLCVGRNLIGILAKDGAWHSSGGQTIVAADELLHANPYERAEAAEARMREIEAQTIERCANVASNWSGDFDYPYGQERIATAIRALAKAPS